MKLYFLFLSVQIKVYYVIENTSNIFKTNNLFLVTSYFSL